MPKARQPRKTLVDHLAAKLSELTGSNFTVLRISLDPKFPASGGRGGNKGPLRYLLHAERSGFNHTFQSGHPTTADEMKRFLASLCDMVNMGFIPVVGRMTLEEAQHRQEARHIGTSSFMEPLGIEEEIAFGDKWEMSELLLTPETQVGRG